MCKDPKEYECDRCCQDFERGELRSFGAVKWLCRDCYEVESETSPSDSGDGVIDDYNHGAVTDSFIKNFYWRLGK